ncbi:carbohydrate ABC transporter permease [Tengunoibacter tsumagoiensis]|uniref:ABC transporter permease n=1 Tax=Tengunoibacter tsumagoiensis TaxID=2014871 RepID=A0A401ZZ15_9CHLR|nr:carbohydrate ABC transporter permease [Tengunoibacter tsumagoiensis]GCE12073.1 ABC transporter permease [Tengunoibacter tsumagoiensis]
MALFPAVGRKQTPMRIGWWAVVLVLCVGIFMHMVPFYFMIITSLKEGAETLHTPPTFWPQHPTLQAWSSAFQIISSNYTGVGSDVTFVSFFWNSLFMTGMTVILSTPVTALAAYASAKLLRGPLGRWIFIFFIGTMLLPGSVSLVSSYLLVRHFPFPFAIVPTLPSGDAFPTIDLTDSPWAVIVPAIFNAGGFFYYRAFFQTIPDSIIQSARVDGGSELNIFRRIVMPMSIPVFAIVISGQFGAIWDGYLWPSLVITSPEKRPLSVAVNELIKQFNQSGALDPSQALQNAETARHYLGQGLTWSGVMVLGILQSIPTFLFFVLCFRYMLSGIRIRGLR